jgi:hypothetical protein
MHIRKGITRQVGKPYIFYNLNVKTVLITIFIGLPNNNEINEER